MKTKIRVIHYLNQFFAGIGGEEQASIPPQWFDGPRGPGQLLERAAPGIEVVGTVTAGDNYMAENLEQGAKAILKLIQQQFEADAAKRPGVSLIGCVVTYADKDSKPQKKDLNDLFPNWKQRME